MLEVRKRRSGVLVGIVVLAAVVSACADEEQRSDLAAGAPSAQLDDAGVSYAPFAKAYDPNSPPRETRSANDLHMQTAKTPLSADLDCMGCHAASKTGATTKFAIAGVAMAAPSSTEPLVDGEILVYDGTKELALVKTAQDGYFWLPASKGPFPATAHTAVRDKTGKMQKMKDALDVSGDCSSSDCHGRVAGKIDFKP